jgi:26S proteasome non-ATPase regulatory subunit 9
MATITREQLRELIKKKDAAEQEIMALESALTAPGGAGLKGNLIDSEGFPRSDIDVPKVRENRHRLAVLRTDYKELMQAIEEGLVAIHAASAGERASEPLPDRLASLQKASIPTERIAAAAAAPAPHSGAPTAEPPFALVDEVSAGSPAASAGALPFLFTSCEI